MTGREQHLLALAVQACAERDMAWLKIVPPSPRFDWGWGGWVITVYRPPLNFPLTNGTGPTLAAALEALLADLGVSYPPEPTAEQVADVADFLDLGEARTTVLREAWRDHRQALLALLDEGGTS